MKTLATNPNSTTSPRMEGTRLAGTRSRAFAAVACSRAAVNFDYHKIVRSMRQFMNGF